MEAHLVFVWLTVIRYINISKERILDAIPLRDLHREIEKYDKGEAPYVGINDLKFDQIYSQVIKQGGMGFVAIMNGILEDPYFFYPEVLDEYHRYLLGLSKSTSK